MLHINNTPNYVELSQILFSPICEKYEQMYEKYEQMYEKYFLRDNPNDITELLNVNIDNVKSITSVEENDSKLNNLLDTLKINPFVLFSECYEPLCALSRSGSGGYYRNIFKDKLIEAILNDNNITSSAEFIYTSYYPGFLFQDLIILTKIIKLPILNGIKTLTINFIGDYYEYNEKICDVNCNPNIISNLLDIELNDEHKERRTWMQFLTLRFAYFINWLKWLNPKIELKIRLYPSINKLIEDNVLTDLFIGTDYLDECYFKVRQFLIASLCCTKLNGIIASLRTNGLFTKNIYLDIMRNDSNSKILNLKTQYDEELNILYDELKEESIKFYELDGKEHMYKWSDDDNIRNIGGKNYRFKHGTCDNKGRYDMFVTDKYDSIKEKIDKTRDEHDKKYTELFNNLSKIYNLHEDIKLNTSSTNNSCIIS